MLLWLLLAFSVELDAQPPALPPLVRGYFVDWVGAQDNGSFAFRVSDLGFEKIEHRCLFTPKTYLERDHKRIFITALTPGQPLEILSERSGEPPRCRALIIRAVTELTPPARVRTLRSIPSPTESFAPRGNLVYSGVILHMDDRSFLLRTRRGERHRIIFRGDTRLSEGAGASGRDLIPINTPLQVRAGRTYENEIEAFSISWGDLLQPK